MHIVIVYYFLLHVLFILHIVYSVLHIFVLLPHVANKQSHVRMGAGRTLQTHTD